MFDNVVQSAQQLGSAFGQIFDLSLADYAFMNKQAKPRVLSSKASIKVTVPNFNYSQFAFNGDPEIQIGEIDDFSAQKNFRVIKRFKPLHHKLERVLVEDAGWDLAWSGGKVDWNMARIFYQTEQMVAQEQDGGMTYNTPRFNVEQSITHYDGTVEHYVFRNVVLLGMSQQISGDNDQITESYTAFAEDRIEGQKFKETNKTKITGRVWHIIDAITELNRS